MIKLLTTTFLALFISQAFSQKTGKEADTVNNFGFEALAPNGVMPYKWGKFNKADSYIRQSTTTEKHSGERSLLIEQDNAEDDGFGSVAHSIPAKYEGKEVEFR